MKIRRSAGPHFVTDMLQLEIVPIDSTSKAYVKHDNKINLNNTATNKSQLYTIYENQNTYDIIYDQNDQTKLCNSSVYKSRTRRAVSNTKRRKPDVRYVTLNIEKFLCFLPTKDLPLF